MEVMLPLAGHSRICQEIKQKIKVEGKIVKPPLFSKSLGSQQFSICQGDTIQLSASGGTNYSWTGPTGFISYEQNPSILNANASQSGQYICTISGTGGCDDKRPLMLW
jgi:hypothetical protein